jgi:hypothetical protein
MNVSKQTAIACCALSLLARADVNSQSKLLDAFHKRVTAYVKIHKSAKSEIDGVHQTDSPGQIDGKEHALARWIRNARHGASQGDIFTPEITAAFRKLLAAALAGPDGRAIRESLRRAAPSRPPAIRVNVTYPPGFPLQSTPPSLLLNLPMLPSELEYRVAGHDLILRDRDANLIVDFIPNAIP